MGKKFQPVRIGMSLFICLLLVLPLLGVAAPGRALAQTGAQLEVVATGLNNPRGLAFGPEGALYVAEAGTGGPDCYDTPFGTTFAPCIGQTGSITRILDGSQSRVAEGFFSLASSDGFGALGPVDISFQGRGGAFVVIGQGADPGLRDLFAATIDPAFANLGQLVHMPASGDWRAVTDIGAYEGTANPAGDHVDSNPYAVFATPGGRVIADAGANDLIKVAANGSITTLATFPKRMYIIPPEGLPFPGGPPPGAVLFVDSVPTSVVQGPDGAFYVGELAGMSTGIANVWRVPTDGSPAEVYATGFTAIIDLAFGPDGSLYVLEIFKNGLLAGEIFGDATGALIRVHPDGTREEIASEGLVAPGGMAIGDDGTIFMTNFSIFPGGGQVVSIAQGAAEGGAQAATRQNLQVAANATAAMNAVAPSKLGFLRVDMDRLNAIALDYSTFLAAMLK